MQPRSDEVSLRKFTIASAIVLMITSCTSNGHAQSSTTASLEANIKMYKHTWDEIINHGKLNLFNDSNFMTNVIMHTHPDIVGIDSARAYYANYLTGFSDIKFTIVDVFGQDDKLEKHWKFQRQTYWQFFRNSSNRQRRRG